MMKRMCDWRWARRDGHSDRTGDLTESPTRRILRDANLLEIGAGTTEVHKLIIGRESLGFDAVRVD